MHSKINSSHSICWSNLIFPDSLQTYWTCAGRSMMLKKLFLSKQQLLITYPFLVFLDYWVLYTLRWCIWDSTCTVTSTWLEEFGDKFWYCADSLMTYWTCAGRSLLLKKINFDKMISTLISPFMFICLSVLVCFPIDIQHEANTHFNTFAFQYPQDSNFLAGGWCVCVCVCGGGGGFTIYVYPYVCLSVCIGFPIYIQLEANMHFNTFDFQYLQDSHFLLLIDSSSCPIFPRKQASTFHANCLNWRQFTWNIKSYFLEKIRKNISICCLLKILSRVLSYICLLQ